jgi:hypothetical protein
VGEGIPSAVLFRRLAFLEEDERVEVEEAEAEED